MKISINISEGGGEALIKCKQVGKLTNRAIRAAFQKIGVDLRDSAAKGMLKHPKHGRLYRLKLHGRMVNHIASSDDGTEDPANFTGKLRKSLGYSLNGSSQMSFGAGDQNEVNYALILEKGGTVTKGDKNYRIEPRKYLQRAIKERQGNIRRHFEEQIQMELKK